LRPPPGFPTRRSSDLRPATLAVLIGLGIHTRYQLVVAPLPGRSQTPAQSATVDVGGSWSGHHSAGRRCAQAVVVHHVIGIVVVEDRKSTRLNSSHVKI